MGKTCGAPGALRGARRVREEAPGNGQPATAVPRPWADLTPWRSSILLAAGDKSERWSEWYAEAIPLAEHRYELYVKERAEEESSTP